MIGSTLGLLFYNIFAEYFKLINYEKNIFDVFCSNNNNSFCSEPN